MCNAIIGTVKCISAHAAHPNLSEHAFSVGAFFDEVILHALLEMAIIIPVLFLTYMLMEFIEHRASQKLKTIMEKSGPLGAVVGGVFGALPQCGFSAAAANLYTGRVITLGTLLAVFLSTSDEMIAVMISGNIEFSKIMLIIVYKLTVGILAGLLIDLLLRILKIGKRSIDIDQICENDRCHCERGIVASALHHTLSTASFIFLVTLLLNALIFFIGEDTLSSLIPNIPILNHFVCALLGLIPNCAVSVVLTELCVFGYISVGSMLAGLFSGAGVGLLVLFRMNKNRKENLLITALLLVLGAVFGFIADFLPILSL